jgi:hypothetical protein
MLAAVYSPGNEQDTGSFRNGLGADVSIVCCLADSDWDGGEETEGLVDDGVEDRKGFDFGVRWGFTC